MKRNWIACILALAAISAQASTRVVSGFGSSDVSRAAACNEAKNKVSDRVVSVTGGGERVVSMGQCECDQTKLGKWNCTVNGRIAKNEEETESDDVSGAQGNGNAPSSGAGQVRVQPRPTGVLPGVR